MATASNNYDIDMHTPKRTDGQDRVLNGDDRAFCFLCI